MNHGAGEEQRRALNSLSQQVIDCCLEVHRKLGPGLLETVYEEALAIELMGEGIAFRRQSLLPLRYKEGLLPVTFRIDFLVDDRLVVELKAVRRTASDSLRAGLHLSQADAPFPRFVDQFQCADFKGRGSAGGVGRPFSRNRRLRHRATKQQARGLQEWAG